MNAERLELVAAALASTGHPVCAHVGRVLVHLVASHSCPLPVMWAYARFELREVCANRSLDDGPVDATVGRLATLVGADTEAHETPPPDEWFAPLATDHTTLQHWSKAFRGGTTLWVLLSQRRAHQRGPRTPSTVQEAQDTLASNSDIHHPPLPTPMRPFEAAVVHRLSYGELTKYRVHHVQLPPPMVETMVKPLYTAICAHTGLQWIHAHECEFVHTLHPLWTRRLSVSPGTAFVHDEWDGFAWTMAPRQVQVGQLSPLCASLWRSLDRWQGDDADAIPWNYATLVEYAPSFADKDSEDEYRPFTTATLADGSLVLCLNVSHKPLRLHIRRFRSVGAAPHPFVLQQGEGVVLPQAMLPLMEVVISDPSLLVAETDAASTQGAMLLTLQTSHPFTLYTPAEVQSILHPEVPSSSSSPDTDADSTTVTLALSPACRGRRSGGGEDGGYDDSGAGAGDGAGERAPNPRPALGMKTVVRATPIKCRLDARGRSIGGARRRQRKRIVQLPVVHQLVAVRGRRFAKNAKAKHWFAIVSSVNAAAARVRVEYVNENAFDDIDEPTDLLFPVDDTLLASVTPFTHGDPAYAAVWTLVRDHVQQVRVFEEDALRPQAASALRPPTPPDVATRTNARATPPPSMRPVYATAAQWRVQRQSATMGDGLWIEEAEQGTLLPYTTHARDLDHLVPDDDVDDACDTCAIVMRTAARAEANVLNPHAAERGPGSYANAVDYRLNESSGELVYIPPTDPRDARANAALIEYDGKVYVRLTEGLRGAFVMVEYGGSYACGRSDDANESEHRR